MDARLVPHPQNKDYYLCIITHDYKKSRLSKELQFIFYRTTRETKPTEDLPEISDEALVREFVWYNDEADFTSPPTESDYKIDKVFIDNKPYTINKRVQGTHVIYSCELSHASETMTRVRFDVTIPMEKESILQLTSEFPSKGIKVVFRWNEILSLSPNMTVFPIKKIGLKTSPSQIDHYHGVIEIIHHSWALPKDLCIFAWWN